MRAIAELISVKALFVRYCGLTDESFHPISELAHLETLEIHQGDPVLTDAILPGISGLRRIRQLEIHGPHGFTEVLYAYTSQGNNNGSAFAGYTGFVQPHAPGNAGAHGITFADLMGGFLMLTNRYVPLLAAMAVAGSLATKRVAPFGRGTFRTDTPTFVVLLVGVIVIVAALTFFPALLLGPVVQGLTPQLF